MDITGIRLRYMLTRTRLRTGESTLAASGIEFDASDYLNGVPSGTRSLVKVSQGQVTFYTTPAFPAFLGASCHGSLLVIFFIIP